MSYQQITILGNLGKDPEQKFLPSGDAVTNFSVAVSESWKSKSGEKQEKTTWFRVNTFGKLAEVCGQWLKSGSQVLIAGKMECRDWEDKDGNKRQSWELRADTMKMVGGKKDEQSGASKPAQNQSRSSQGAGPVNAFDDMTDDIPF